jgi:hypothetical protein
MTAHAEAANKRNHISDLNFEEGGARLRLELQRVYKDLRHTGEFKAGGNDVSDVVKKYISPLERLLLIRRPYFEVPDLI